MSKLQGNPAPIDKDVVVPEAVRRAAAAADAAMAAQNPQPPAEPPAPANNDTISIVSTPPDRLPGQVPLQIEQAPPAPQHTPEKVPQPAPDAENGTWEQKYNSILGRYRDATAQLQHTNARVEALENMLASVRSAPAAPQPQAPQPSRYVTPQDEEQMGGEMIDLMRRVTREETQGYTALQQELASVKQQLNGVTTQTTVDARTRMHQKLDQDLPNWQQINHDADFHAWLALQDPFSGVIRHKLLKDAYDRNDAARVLTFFNSFVSDTAAVRPADPVTAPPPASQPVRPSLESFAAPGRARTAASPPAPAEKQPIRTSDINAFYADVRKGLYAGREAELRQHEAELHQAMREGRIIRDT